MEILTGWLTNTNLATVAGLTVVAFGLGCLPLPLWIVRLLAHQNLRELGTGNLSVSATFKQVGPSVGVAVVCAEIFRGIAPVVAAMWLLPAWPAAQLWGLVPLVVGRSAIAKGGGVTNVAWGTLLYSPGVFISSALTGLVVLAGARTFIHGKQKHTIGPAIRRWSARIGCISGAVWVAVFEKTLAECWVALGLVGLLVWIDLQQTDDAMALVSLDRPLAPKQYGAKAARLAQLKRKGIQVPQGWGILKSQAIDSNVLKQIKPSDTHPLMVRSSAIGEDGDSSSAAGQYRTVGPVRSAAELMAAIEVCRDSYGGGGAVAYRQDRALPDTGMSILIQRYVEGQVSGVAFSRHPLHGGEQIVIEALPGGAEAVVGGTQTPVHWEIPRSSGTIDCDEYCEAAADNLLPASVLHELVGTILAIEALFDGVPQDVEWIWDGDRIWIVQSRPISTLQPVWTRTIAAEVIPGAIHPLTWSINRPLTCGVWGDIFSVVLGKGAVDLDFSETATLLCSHAYFNATLLGEIFRRMGLPEQGLEFLLRGQKMGRPPLVSTLSNVPGLLRLKRKEGRLPQDFYRDFDTLFQPALVRLESTPLTSLSPSQLLEQIDFIRETLVPATYYNIVGPIGLAIRKSLFKVSEEWLDDQPAPELAALRQLAQLAAMHRAAKNCNGSETGCISNNTVPNVSPEEIDGSSSEGVGDPQLQSQFETWLEQYGYLSEAGTDIAVPTWRELPDTIQALFQTFIQQPEVAPRNRPLGPQNVLQKWRVRQCRERAGLQAKIDEVYARFLAHLRWTFVELEGRGRAEGILHDKGDIFFLQLSEVKDWVGGMFTKEQLQTLVSQRKLQWESDRERTIPTVVYGNRLPPVDPELAVNGNLKTDDLMSGIPASGGCVEGTVKICRQLNFERFEPGTIVVVPYTDAGWAPLLVNAVAIVAEVGGQLSHGAIVAREYNIPAVMNVEQAMARLQDGQRVRVDGDRGTVELC